MFVLLLKIYRDEFGIKKRSFNLFEK